MRQLEGREVRPTDGDKVTVYYSGRSRAGNRIMRPGLKFKVEGTPLERLDFVSLMLALFLGTAALPHILIRYYTVPSPAAARKSTIVAIAAIGFFYILTLFMGLGAMISGVINPADSNMAAPLLARSFGDVPVRDHLGHRLRHRAGHGQRPDRRRLGRGGARPAGPLRRVIKMDDRQKVRGRQDLGLRRRRRWPSCWASSSRA